MKKTLLFLLIISKIQAIYAQSTLISPANGIEGIYNNNQTLKIQTPNNKSGFEHTDGNVILASFIALNAAYLMTKTLHPLHFSTNGLTVPTMTLATSGNVGIGTSSPTEKLHVVGDVRISGLAGSGIRTVKADQNGVLTTSVQTNYYHIPRSSFLSVSGNVVNEIANGGIYCAAGSVGFLEAPIQLPDGATITNMTIYYVDNSGKNLFVELHRRAYTATTSTSLGSFTSSGSAGAGGSGNILNSLIGISSNNIVDNNAYVYYLRVSAVNSMNIAAVWDGVNLTINQVKITYSY